MSIGGAALPAGRDGDDGDAARLSGSVSAPWDPAEWEAAWSDPCFDTDPPEPAWIADAHRESTWAALSASTTGPVGRDALTLLAELNAAQLASGARTADRAELHRASARRESHGDQRAGPRVRCDGTSEDAGDVVDGNGCGKRCRPRGAAGEESDTYERSRPHVSRTETARTLLDGIVLAQRVVNHVQAVQQRLIAALSRPGVAVPLADLVDLAGTDLTDTLAVAADTAMGTAASTASGETLPDNTTVNGIMSPLERAAQNRGSAVGAEPAARDRDPWAALAHPVHGPVIREAAVKAAAAEIGCALNWAPITARMRCEAALEMVDSLPATLAAQHRGDIDSYRAKLIAERTVVLSAGLRRRMEARVLPVANTCTAASLRRLLDREVIAVDPTAANKRCEQARQERTVVVRRGEDDMGVFTAIVPAADGETAYGVLDTAAAQLAAAGLSGGRSRDQLRADAFADLFRTLADTGCVHLTAMCRAEKADGQPAGGRDSDPAPAGGAPAAGFGFAARPLPCGPADTVVSLRRPVALNVYLDAATLAQLNDLPGEIAGYGAITADTARALAASADTIRAILIRPAWENSTAAASAGANPETGCGRRNHIGHGSSDPDPGSRADGIDRRSLNPDTPCAGAGLLLDTGSGIDSRPDLGRSDPAGPNTNEQTHRACGTILDAGRAVYRPPDGTTDYVTARDRTCQFPGCRAPAARCDLDHRIPFDAGGVTCPHNLDALCRSHHRLKTFTTWTATRDAATDRLTWTSPLGRSHATEPSHLLHDALLVHAPPAVDDPPPF